MATEQVARIRRSLSNMTNCLDALERELAHDEEAITEEEMFRRITKYAGRVGMAITVELPERQEGYSARCPSCRCEYIHDEDVVEMTPSQ